jgi:hypothetical protein
MYMRARVEGDLIRFWLNNYYLLAYKTSIHDLGSFGFRNVYSTSSWYHTYIRDLRDYRDRNEDEIVRPKCSAYY